MGVTGAKERAFVVGIFGGGSESLPDEAESLGRIIATATNWIVLTGGSGPDRHSSAVKHRALVGPCDLKRPWMGLLQATDHLRDPPCTNGFVFKTPLGHKRNYLEAVLCDAAFAFPGGSGTFSEVVTTLCLRKPVILIGDRQWSDAKPGPDGKLAAETKRKWINKTLTKFRGEPRVPAIDCLIRRDIASESLVDVERRLAVVPADQLQSAVDGLANLLDVR